MRKFYFFICLTAFVLAACGSKEPVADSPSGALKQYVAASQKQDIAKMKSLLSKGSLEFIEKNAKAQNRTVDDILRAETAVKIQNAPETRNEKIEGDTATVEVKNETNGEFDLTMPFVREDGAWKLARDKMIEDMLKKANEAREKLILDIKKASNANVNSANTNASSNK